ncbi:MAG TPA: hypothetical protein VFX15_07545 [Actinomycetes bacterium]|nr:hypothetical protein [Actinomycetes bacterium]
MRRAGIVVVSLPLSLVVLTGCSDRPEVRPDDPGLVINTSSFEPDTGTSLRIFPGTLDADEDGCVYLQTTSDGEQDLVWPVDYKTSETAVYQTRQGTQLRIGKKVSLVGIERAPDDDLVCRHTDGSAIFISDFLGETTGGG